MEGYLNMAAARNMLFNFPFCYDNRLRNGGRHLEFCIINNITQHKYMYNDNETVYHK